MFFIKVLLLFVAVIVALLALLLAYARRKLGEFSLRAEFYDEDQ